MTASEFPHPEGERRQITAMFCDLVGSTNLSTRIDPEDYHDIIRGFQRTCAEVIERFGGYIGQYLGDGILVFFGYPSASEDAAQRAVRSGLGIIDAVRDLNVRLQREHALQINVRAGIHTGAVILDEVGRQGRHEPQALGETLNIAAWLQSFAEPNTVVVSGDTLRLIEGYFSCESHGSYPLKGTTIQISLHRVVCESGSRSPIDVAAMRGLTPLVGRGAELLQLQAHWVNAKAGRGRVVLLSGDPGIGKSRLVQAVKDSVATENYGREECRCSSYAQQTSLYPLIDLLQRLQNWEKDDTSDTRLAKLERFLEDHQLSPAENIPLFASLLELRVPSERYRPLNMTPERQKERTLEILWDLLVARAGKNPLLFVVEDLHWSDSTTVEFLALMIRRASKAPILTLLTSRSTFQPPWAPHDCFAHLSCSGLGEDRVREMVEGLTGGARLPSTVLEHIVTKTDGIPLFVEELTKMILESGLLRKTNGEYSLTKPLGALAIPTTLQDSLMARLDRLGEAKAIAQLAAVLGRRFEVSLLNAVSSVDEVRVRRSLRQLVDAGLLYPEQESPEGAFVFKHALIRDTAYESLLRQTRRQYHQRIAEILVERFQETQAIQPEVISHHYKAAGLDRQAIPWNVRAARTQVARAAYAEARQYSEEALKAFDPSAWSSDYDFSAELHLLVAECRYLTQDLEAFNQLFDDLLNNLREKSHRSRLYELKLLILYNRGLPRESVDCGLEAIRMLGLDFPTDPTLIIPAIGVEMETIQRLIGTRKPADLLNLPPLTDEQTAFIISLVLRMQPAAHTSHQVELFALMALKNLRLTLEYGNGVDAPGVYSMFAIVTQVMTGDSQKAYEFSRLAIELDEKQGRRQKCSVMFIHAYFINHWVNPLEESQEMSIEGAKAGFESGDLTYACFHTANYVINLNRTGAPLEEVIRVAARHYEIIDNRVSSAAFHCILEMQMAKALAGRTDSRLSLTDREYDESRDLASIKLFNQLGWYFVTKLVLHYYCGDYSTALEFADKALSILASSQGQVAESEFVLFDALTSLARCAEVNPQEEEKLLERAMANLEKLRRWSLLCEANFAHKQFLVEAEFARVCGEKANAIRLYETAARSADKFKFIQHAALAKELAGRYFAELGDLDSARKWLKDACDGYQTWGARAKVEDLHERYPLLDGGS